MPACGGNLQGVHGFNPETLGVLKKGFLESKDSGPHQPFEVEQLADIPASSNPFHHDLYNMGQKFGKNLLLMFGNYDTEHCGYLILVNTDTGKRIKIFI